MVRHQRLITFGSSRVTVKTVINASTSVYLRNNVELYNSSIFVFTIYIKSVTLFIDSVYIIIISDHILKLLPGNTSLDSEKKPSADKPFVKTTGNQRFEFKWYALI